MIDPANVQEVGASEVLARYVLQSSHVRRSNQSVKPDAFVPHPHKDLSVTRHLRATEDELWSVGQAIAVARGITLYGRGDISASHCMAQRLSVKAAPIEKNPNHANVSDWPADKASQKMIAQELAATASFVPAQRR